MEHRRLALWAGLFVSLVAVAVGAFNVGCDRADRETPLAPGLSSGEGTSAPTHDYGEDCVSCHAEYAAPKSGGPSLVPGTLALEQITHADLLCTTCHEPHGKTTNLRNIREQIPTPSSGIKNVTFTKYYGTLSLADGDGTYNGICEVCHTTTTYHRNNSTGDHTHKPGARCTGCHLHNARFMPVLNECSSCHNQTQPAGQGDYRRQIVSSGGTGGDFLRTSHHVNTGLPGESVQSVDCVVCHNNSRHSTVADPQVRLFSGDNGGSTITYNGTPASVEPFCLSCHDPDGGPQFSDGKTPPGIETAWLSSSHKIAGTTCYGDGTSLGCHANGHGSDKVALKAPFTGATPDQEAFCYRCHDADGPAASNVQLDFSGTLSLTAPWNSAKLNQHHDVSVTDQTFSGAAIECKNCHNPHSANPAQPTLADVDPGDGHSPGAGNIWSSSNFTSGFCLECHDNSYPAGVTAPTTALTNVYTEWTDSRGDQHGPALAASNFTARPGSGYARGDHLNCDVCHDVGHGNSTNLFQLKTTIYSKDGTTPLVSDAGTTVVYVTNIDPGNTDKLTNSQNWCSTCHPSPMGGTKDKNCFGCHVHGGGRF